MAIIDQNLVTDTNWFRDDAATGGYATNFTGAGTTIANAHVWLSRDILSAAGNLYVCIYASSGTPGTNAIPSGAPLATSNAIALSSLTTSNVERTATFSGINQITLTNGAVYMIGVVGDGGGTSGDGWTIAGSSSAVSGRDLASAFSGGLGTGPWSSQAGSIKFILNDTTSAAPTNLFFF